MKSKFETYFTQTKQQKSKLSHCICYKMIELELIRTRFNTVDLNFIHKPLYDLLTSKIYIYFFFVIIYFFCV